MKKFEVVAFRSYTGYEKVHLSVEANNKEEALELVINNADNYEEIDAKGVGCDKFNWIDEEE